MIAGRQNPFVEMISVRNALDRLLEQSFVRGDRSLTSELAGARALPMDLYEKDGDYVMKAYVPGAKVEDIEINVDGGKVLTVKARLGNDVDKRNDKNCKRLTNELAHGKAVRTVALPTTVEVNRIEAIVENGVLTVTLPKAEESKPKQIRVTAN